MVEQIGPNDDWPEAISNGLALACGMCRQATLFDYLVEDATWAALVPPEHQRGVVCLPCLDRIATSRGVVIGQHLLQVQFTGTGHTAILRPTRVIDYRERLDRIGRRS